MKLPDQPDTERANRPMVTVTQAQIPNSPINQNFKLSTRLTNLGHGLTDAEINSIDHLYTLLEGVVEHQQDIIGDTEVQHALQVVEILATIRVDTDMIIACLLYSLLQTSVLSQADISADYEENISLLVDNIGRLRIIETQQAQTLDSGKDRQQVESIRKLLIALADDLRVVMVILAERLHLMRKLKCLPDKLCRQLASETRDIYAPLANRLGIWQVKWELEDLAFRYTQPETYQRIAKMLDEKRVDREKYIDDVVTLLSSEVAKVGITANINGRAKHIYSIWRKMSKKSVGFNELYDVRATRVLVDKVSDCYTILGIVHSLWPPIRSEFDDYIAVPKDNEYQSLHTAVIGPGEKTVEIQIRTHEMHEHSEYGVASHWGYKEGGKQDLKYQEKIAWLRRLLEWKEENTDDSDLLEQFKTELFDDRVYVLTPQRKVIDLPFGATTLDFAYYIHTEVGHRYRGAKVDGKIVTLGYILKNGQQVEILTSKHSQPSRDWLNPNLAYVGCSRTRSKIRTWFRQQDYANNLIEGQRVLDHELKRLGVRQLDMVKLLKRFNFAKTDDMLASLGRGDTSLTQIASALNEYLVPLLAPPPEYDSKTVPRLMPVSKQHAQDDIRVMGLGDLLTKMAGCCKPVPFDEITGYITRGRGVTVHRQDCPSLLRLKATERERLIEASWGQTTSSTYPADVQIRAFDRYGLLHDITLIFSNEKLNVVDVNTHTDKGTYIARMLFSVEVTDAVQLNRALTKIEHLSNVLEVSRK